MTQYKQVFRKGNYFNNKTFDDGFEQFTLLSPLKDWPLVLTINEAKMNKGEDNPK
jgi:hypothetical protein